MRDPWSRANTRPILVAYLTKACELGTKVWHYDAQQTLRRTPLPWACGHPELISPLSRAADARSSSRCWDLDLLVRINRRTRKGATLALGLCTLRLSAWRLPRLENLLVRYTLNFFLKFVLTARRHASAGSSSFYWVWTALSCFFD